MPIVVIENRKNEQDCNRDPSYQAPKTSLSSLDDLSAMLSFCSNPRWIGKLPICRRAV
jgi:hypothetical protein